MPINATKSFIYAGALILCVATSALAERFTPFGPYVTQDDTLQLFAPAELGDFGDRPDPNQGFFFGYERFDWTTSPATSTPVGVPGFTPIAFTGGSIIRQRSTVVNAVPKAENGWGNRFELGYLRDQDGWILGVTEGFTAGQIQEYGHKTKNVEDVSIVFRDPFGVLDDFIDLDRNGTNDDINGDGFLDELDFVRYASFFDQLRVRDVVEIDSVELMKMHRFKMFHRGGVLEVYGGAKFFKYNDLFQIIGQGSILGNLQVNTQANNNIIGPQVGLRYSNTRERWTVGLEGRFLAGANFQSTRQDGYLASFAVPGGSVRPRGLFPSTFNNEMDDVRFSPVGEMRVFSSYNITRNTSFKVGWTGTFVGSIARAANQNNYTLSNMGLLADSQDSFTHGVNFGFEVNR